MLSPSSGTLSLSPLLALPVSHALLLSGNVAMDELPRHLTESDLDRCFLRASQASMCVTSLQTLQAVDSTFGGLHPNGLLGMREWMYHGKHS